MNNQTQVGNYQSLLPNTMNSRTKKVSVQENVDIGAIANQFSDMFTNTIIDQLQAFVDICQDMRIDPEQLRSSLKVYSQRTGIVGIRVRKTKRSTWTTQQFATVGTKRDDHGIFQRPELDEPISELEYNGKIIRYYADVRLEDGYSPAFNSYGEVSLALLRDTGDEVKLRKLDEADTMTLEDHGIEFVLY